MKSSAQARRQTRSHSSCVASALPQRRFSQDRAGEQHVLRSHDRDLVTQRRPGHIHAHRARPTRTLPSDTSYRREIRLTRLDFALPVPPRMRWSAGLDVQVDVLQDGLSLALPVGEADVVKIHAAVRNGRERLRRAGEVGFSFSTSQMRRRLPRSCSS